jgi:hypothetical protein
MRLRKRTVLLSVLAVCIFAAAGLLWRFWPLIAFLRGQPVFYSLADLPVSRAGAAPIAVVGATLIDGNGGPPLENSAIVIRDGASSK